MAKLYVAIPIKLTELKEGKELFKHPSEFDPQFASQSEALAAAADVMRTRDPYVLCVAQIDGATGVRPVPGAPAYGTWQTEQVESLHFEFVNRDREKMKFDVPRGADGKFDTGLMQRIAVMVHEGLGEAAVQRVVKSYEKAHEKPAPKRTPFGWLQGFINRATNPPEATQSKDEDKRGAPTQESNQGAVSGRTEGTAPEGTVSAGMSAATGAGVATLGMAQEMRPTHLLEEMIKSVWYGEKMSPDFLAYRQFDSEAKMAYCSPHNTTREGVSNAIQQAVFIMSTQKLMSTDARALVDSMQHYDEYLQDARIRMESGHPNSYFESKTIDLSSALTYENGALREAFAKHLATMDNNSPVVSAYTVAMYRAVDEIMQQPEVAGVTANMQALANLKRDLAYDLQDLGLAEQEGVDFSELGDDEIGDDD